MRLRSALVACGLLSALGCSAPVEGQRKELAFDFEVADDPFGRSTLLRIAEGTKPRLGVYLPVQSDLARAELVEITGFRIVGEPTVTVTPDGPHALRLEAKRPGTTSLGVAAAGRTDEIHVEVVAVEGAFVRRPIFAVDGAPLLVALEGGRARFSVTFFGRDQQPILAVGLAPPIALDPPGAGKVLPPPPDEGAFAEIELSGRGFVVLGAGTPSPLDVLVVGEGDVESVEPRDMLGSSEPASVFLVELGAVARDRPALVVSTGISARTLTPEVCAPWTGAEFERVQKVFGYAVVGFTATAPGRCEVELGFAGKSARTAREVDPKARRNERLSTPWFSSSPSASPSSSGKSP